MRSSTETLIASLRILSRDTKSDDGVANAAIAEAADRLEELYRSVLDKDLTIVTLEEIVTDDNRSHEDKVLGFRYVLGKMEDKP